MIPEKTATKPKPKPLPLPTTAERIRIERERLGLTKAEAARLLGVRPDSYTQLEGAKGRVANPSLDTLAKLVRAGFRLKAIAPDLVPETSEAL